ncbi:MULTISPECIES: hypothetical protein [Hallerella]|uniref:hypothetical protein n=1 Tax=Hallerella TaxID=2815788 RepID=UPI000D0CD7EB|nr:MULTISPECIES: hypothetical protein [Hallerella]MBS7392042.1 hypothetical protein [Fibrobacter sp.]MCI6874065.1 hypothetical protein [Hallerella sp.]MDD6091280.1 hypothetical protein [Hallerella succinigenes]MDY5028674.1 hypothetical protein [Hallerella succinigenes]
MQENELAMQNALAKNSNIQISTKFFGLLTKVIYKPTASPISKTYLEYDPAEGALVEQILFAPSTELSALCNHKLKASENGKFSLYLLASKDHRFAALQLSEYSDFSYAPVGEIRIVEGDDARQILQVFV